MYRRAHIILSSKFAGSFMVPEEGSWNYNFRGINHRVDMKYGVKLGVPKEFYNEEHRPNHFLKFSEEITTNVFKKPE